MSFLIFLVQLVLYYLFLVAAVVLSVIQIGTYFFIWPLSKGLYRRVNYYLAYLIWGNVTCWAQHWCPTKLNIYMSDQDFEMLGKENAVCIVNHKYTVDWLMGWVICQNIGLLGGCKVFLKNSLKYVPLLGWSFSFAEQIFVKRVWETDSKTLKKDLDAIFNEYPPELKYCVVMFCEGTRFSKEKHQASMEIAKQKGFPLLKHHLLPRTRGFEMLISQVEGKVDHLYDLTLVIDDVNGETPCMRHIKNGVGLNVHAFFRRIPVSTFNIHDREDSARFLHQLYREKDEIFDTFKTTGNYDKTKFRKVEVKKNYYDLFNASWMCLMVLIPSAYYFYGLFMGSSLLVKVVLGLALVSTNYAIEFLMYYTDPRYASKFGLKEK